MLDHLAMLERDYRKLAEPWLRRLAEIEALRPSPPIFIDMTTPEQRQRIEALIKEGT